MRNSSGSGSALATRLTNYFSSSAFDGNAEMCLQASGRPVAGQWASGRPVAGQWASGRPVAGQGQASGSTWGVMGPSHVA